MAGTTKLRLAGTHRAGRYGWFCALGLGNRRGGPAPGADLPYKVVMLRRECPSSLDRSVGLVRRRRYGTVAVSWSRAPDRVSQGRPEPCKYSRGVVGDQVPHREGSFRKVPTW